MITKSKITLLFSTLFTFIIFLNACKTEFSENKTERAGIYITLNAPYRNAAPDTFQETYCYAGLIKSGNQIKDENLKSLTNCNNSWYYQMDSSEMLNTGFYDFYIFSASSDENAKSIKKAPLYAKLTLQISSSIIKYTEIANLSINSLSDEKGSINLQIKLPENSRFGYVISKLSSENTDCTNYLAQAEQNISDSTFIISSESIPAGNYDLLMKFYDQKDGNLLFLKSESIDIWPNTSTDKWYLGNGQPDQELTISENIINSTYFVRGSSPALYGSAIVADNASDSATGGLTNPLESINEAVKRIAAGNIPSKEYTIYLDGTTELSDTISIDSDKDLNLTINSLSNNKEKGNIDGLNTLQCIHVGKASGTSKINLKLKNITVKNGSAENGAGIYIENNASVTILDTNIESNHASSNGGGIYNQGSFTLENGSIENNSSDNNGGAAFTSGAFIVKGGNIPFGTNNKNDVFLSENAFITIGKDLKDTPLNMVITAENWTNYTKTVIISEDLDIKFNDDLANRFSYTNKDFENLVTYEEKSLMIDAPVYVSKNSNSNPKGTKSDPFNTLSEACTKIQSLHNLLSSITEYTIYVDGKIEGSQIIPDSLKNIENLTICGVNEDNTKDYLDGNQEGTTLTVKSAVPVTIKNLKITGGDGTYLNQNKIGGGIILEKNATLKLAEGSLVSGNTLSGETSYGGGIYLYEDSNLFLNSNAIIGSPETLTNPATNATIGTNIAALGAGIYSQGNIYLGYSSWTDENKNEKKEFTGKINGNFSTLQGGGIYLYRGNLQMASGNICFNSSIEGGGIKNSDTINIHDGNISSNHAETNGGGIYNASTLNIFDGKIDSNSADSNGGGIYNNYSNGRITFEGGSIKSNTAKSNGGGVYISNSSNVFMYENAIIENNQIDGGEYGGAGVYIKNATLNMYGGSIINNTISIPSSNNVLGGAIYTAEQGNLNIRGKIAIPYGDSRGKNDIKLQSIPINVTGEVSFDENTNYIAEIIPVSYSLDSNIVINSSNVDVTDEMLAYVCKNMGIISDGNTKYAISPLGYLERFVISIAELDSAPSASEYPTVSLSTVAELEKLSSWVSNGNKLSGIEIILKDDVDTNNKEIMIGTPEKSFSGTFDGNSHTITNTITTIDSRENYYALFPYIYNATIKNLRVEGTSTRAGLAGKVSSSTIENCVSNVNVNSTLNDAESYCGGLVAIMTSGTIRNCVNLGNVTASKCYAAGGIAGYANSGSQITIENCINKGNLEDLYGSGNNGGIFGYLSNSNSIIRNCKNSGTIKNNNGGNRFGGILGNATGSNLSILNCSNSGKVNEHNSGAGIVYESHMDYNNVIKNCVNTGDTYCAISDTYKEDYFSSALTNVYTLSGSSTYLYNTKNIETSGVCETYNESSIQATLQSLNNWATSNSNDSVNYVQWKKTGTDQLEIDLGELDLIE